MKRGLGWPIAIVTILGITVAANIWGAVLAGDDPSFAVEPDYYHKAVNWDSTLAQSRENERLGWRIATTLGAFDVKAGAHLSVTLVDSTGAPIADAVVHVAALYNARADQIFQATLSSTGGTYAAMLPVAHAGEWELRFEVLRGGRKFTSTSRVEAVAAKT